ncbi:MAG: hypothetical protein ACK4MQ_02975 [Hyphomonas sp.]
MMLRPILSRQEGTSRPADLALMAICVLILLLPAILNGRPFMFADFNQYFSIGKGLIDNLAGLIGAGDPPPAISPAETAPAPAGEEAESGYFLAIAAGRSPLYSLAAYGLTAFASVWLLPVLQAALTVWLVFRFVRCVGGTRSHGFYLGAFAILSFLSPLGLHVNFLMPDIFGGLLVLAAALLIFDKSQSLPENLLLAALVSAAAFLHTANLMLAGAAFVIAVILWRLPPARGLVNARAPLYLAAAALLAAGTMTGYRAAITIATGTAPGSPNFLAARVYADGPGRLHLEEACAADPARYAHCVFAGHDYAHHNELIWGGLPGPEKPTFIDSPPELKRALQAEEREFVINAIAARPLMQTTASLGNFGEALFSVGIAEVDEGAVHVIQNFLGADPQALAHIPGMERCLDEPSACREGNMFKTIWRHLVGIASLMAMAGFAGILAAWYVAHPDRRHALQLPSDRRWMIGMFLILMVLANAAICGMLSGVHDRYQARLVWVLPLMLLAVLPQLKLALRDGPSGLAKESPEFETPA